MSWWCSSARPTRPHRHLLPHRGTAGCRPVTLLEHDQSVSEWLDDEPGPKPYRIHRRLLVAEILWVGLTACSPLGDVLLEVHDPADQWLRSALWIVWALATVAVGGYSVAHAASWAQAVLSWFVWATIGGASWWLHSSGRHGFPGSQEMGSWRLAGSPSCLPCRLSWRRCLGLARSVAA